MLEAVTAIICLRRESAPAPLCPQEVALPAHVSISCRVIHSRGEALLLLSQGSKRKQKLSILSKKVSVEELIHKTTDFACCPRD